MTIKTGYIGLGNIGKPMCENLIKHRADNGLDIHVYDVVPEPVAEMAELGAIAAESPKAIAQSCDLIGLCVRHDGDVDDLLYGDEGMLANGRQDAIIAIHSTVTRDNILRWANDAKRFGIHVIDAPITGGAGGAADGTLCIMVGGEPSIVERAAPMFAGTSKKVVHGGELGSGIVLKLANNLVTYAAMTACSEAIAMVKNAGVEMQRLFDVGEANGVITPSAQQFINGREGLLAGCTAEEVEAIFGPFAGLGEKDLDHALTLAQQLGLSVPLTEQVRAGIRDTFLRGVQPEH